MNWKTIAEFTVVGEPKPQPRPRAFARKVGPGKFQARVYEAGTAEGWKGLVALCAKPHLPEVPIAAPVRIKVIYWMPRPQRLLRRRDPDGSIPHTSKPDIDNLNKALADCLTQLGMWRDDGQVVEIWASKLYHPKGQRPGADIRIEVMEREPVGEGV